MAREAHLAHDNLTKHLPGNAGTTALGFACYGGHLATVAFLQSRGAKASFLVSPDKARDTTRALVIHWLSAVAMTRSEVNTTNVW